MFGRWRSSLIWIRCGYGVTICCCPFRSCRGRSSTFSCSRSGIFRRCGSVQRPFIIVVRAFGVHQFGIYIGGAIAGRRDRGIIPDLMLERDRIFRRVHFIDRFTHLIPIAGHFRRFMDIITIGSLFHPILRSSAASRHGGCDRSYHHIFHGHWVFVPSGTSFLPPHFHSARRARIVT